MIIVLSLFAAFYISGLTICEYVKPKNLLQKVCLIYCWPYVLKKEYRIWFLSTYIGLFFTALCSISFLIYLGLNLGAAFFISCIIGMVPIVGKFTVNILAALFSALALTILRLFSSDLKSFEAHDNPTNFIELNFKNIFFTICSFSFFTLLIISFALKKNITFAPSNNSSNYEKTLITSAFETYKSEGMTGLKILSQSQYENLPSKPNIEQIRKCALVDMFAITVHNQFVRELKFPKDEYFNIESFQQRIGKHFLAYGISMDEANSYLRKWESSVNREIANLK